MLVGRQEIVDDEMIDYGLSQDFFKYLDEVGGEGDGPI